MRLAHQLLKMYIGILNVIRRPCFIDFSMLVNIRKIGVDFNRRRIMVCIQKIIKILWATGPLKKV